MKRWIRGLSFLIFALAGAGIARGQCANYTTVQATVQDPQGIPYAGMVTAELFPTGGSPTCTPQFGGTNLPFTANIGPTPTDGNGHFSLALPTSANIQPGGTQWTLQVNVAPGVLPPLGTGPQTCKATVTVSPSGGTQTVTFPT